MCACVRACVYVCVCVGCACVCMRCVLFVLACACVCACTTTPHLPLPSQAGRSVGQMYFTACGTLVFRVYAKSMWGGAADFVTEEYMRLEDQGNVIVSRQMCKHLASGKMARQYLIGNWMKKPPPGHV